ncbi:hypothetical protein [Bradyrhizobium australiense]|uniref:Uncharacterized protein n=1 Tax=Bradyrhizobium australiense TaxID=2721161 RepID=A0A7Y4GSW5_9BRAD|nr:hypothetical protein [Bradyrhizobium australiense]NOJ41380.1 hypothetical protein [Bradyrhizobium australiense]
MARAGKPTWFVGAVPSWSSLTMSENHTVICAACKLTLTGPENPSPADIFSCPQCQAGDTYEAVMKEVKSYATEQAAKRLQAHMKGIATGNKFTYKPGRIETRNYRFIIDGM